VITKPVKKAGAYKTVQVKPATISIGGLAGENIYWTDCVVLKAHTSQNAKAKKLTRKLLLIYPWDEFW
jgi:hypothetical protein